MADRRSTETLLYEARRAMGWSQRDLARALGVSIRTGERWSAGRSAPSNSVLVELARLLFPRDPDLALEIDARGRGGLRKYGHPEPPPLVRPAPPSPPPAPPPIPLERRVDIVVCAAAAALDASPRAVKPAVVAAFRAAVESGLSPAEVVHGLAEPPPPSQRAAKRT